MLILLNENPTVHTFHSTGEAYDECQCNDDIQKGDILLIPSEGVVGIAYTWPFAITSNKGDLHGITDIKSFIASEIAGEFDSSRKFDWTPSVKAAITVAKSNNFNLEEQYHVAGF